MRTSRRRFPRRGGAVGDKALFSPVRFFFLFLPWTMGRQGVRRIRSAKDGTPMTAKRWDEAFSGDDIYPFLLLPSPWTGATAGRKLLACFIRCTTGSRPTATLCGTLLSRRVAGLCAAHESRPSGISHEGNPLMTENAMALFPCTGSPLDAIFGEESGQF